MTNQKYQPRPGQKVHGLITMDRFKTTCPKWPRCFLDAYPKWVFFWKKNIIKKIKKFNSESLKGF
jgi:hypothetical protein